MNIPLPAFIDAEAWAGFCEMRKAHKVPFTSQAAKMILAELYRIKDLGHCPNAALDQSTLNGWKDVWPARDKMIERKAATSSDDRIEAEKRAKASEQARLDEYLSRTTSKPPPGLRRVA